jgi:hypothetical protein
VAVGVVSIQKLTVWASNNNKEQNNKIVVNKQQTKYKSEMFRK